MNKLLKECQRLTSLLDGTQSEIGYSDDPGPLGTGEVSTSYDARTQGWRAQASWGHGCVLITPSGDYPKDAIRGLHRLLVAQVEALTEPLSRGRR